MRMPAIRFVGILTGLAAALSAPAETSAKHELAPSGEFVSQVLVPRGKDVAFSVDGFTKDANITDITCDGWDIWASAFTKTHDAQGGVTGLYRLLTADDWNQASAPDDRTTVPMTVRVTGRYDAVKAANNQFTLHVAVGRENFPRSVYVGVMAGEGTVTGCPDQPVLPGKTITLKAAPASGYVFSGWHCQSPPGWEYRLVSKEKSLTLDPGDFQELGFVLEAAFDPTDSAPVQVYDLNERSLRLNETISVSAAEVFLVESGPVATVTVSGLPTGLKYDAKSGSISGKVTKEGRFYVTVAAKNEAGWEHSASAWWTVGNPPETDFGEIDGLPGWWGRGNGMNAGDWIDEGFLEGQSLSSLTVKGLPPGLSLDNRPDQGRWWLHGVLTTPGCFTVETTAKSADGGVRKSVSTVVVKDSGSTWLNVRLAEGMSGRGTVTGGGVCRWGETVKLTAKAEKGFAFAGWSGSPLDFLDDFDRWNPTPSFPLPCRDNTVEARFVKPEEDCLNVNVCDRAFVVGESVYIGSWWDVFSIESRSTPTVTVAGLPTGLAWDVKTRVLSGVPTKEGHFWVTVSAKNANGFEHSATARWTVGEPEDSGEDEREPDAGSVYYRVRPEAGKDAYGTVTGSGVYRVGATVKLSAKANAGYVFGWWSGGIADTLETSFANRSPTLSGKLSDGCGTESVATFLSLSEDWLAVDGGDQSFSLNEPIGERPFDEFFSLDSGSLPTVSVAGLPTGLKFDAKTMTISGKPTKEGLFDVTVSAKNAGGYEQLAVACWTVGEPEWPYYDEIGLPSCGDGMYRGEFYEEWIDVSGSRSFTIKGLPTGLSSKTQGGMCHIYGMLSKSGRFVVEATDVPYDGETRKAKVQVTVRDSGKSCLNARSKTYAEARGTVTGFGVYPAGTSVKLTAKAEKGYVFAGWSGGAADGLDFLDRLNPTLAYTTGLGREDIFAEFIPLREDRLWISVEGRDFGLGDEVDESFWSVVSVDSGSLPTLSVTGLPTGLKYDAKKQTISGKATKEGIFWVTVSAKNAGGFEHSAVARWTVGYPEDPGSGDIVEDEGSCYLDVVASSNAWGQVTGSGVYRVGTTAKVSAKPAKGFVFCGWFWKNDDWNPATFASGGSRQASGSLRVTADLRDSGRSPLVARFAPEGQDDWIGLSFSGEGVSDDGVTVEWTVRNADADVCFVAVDSLSSPTVAVKNLPAGCVWDEELSGLVFTKPPEKAATYVAELSGKTASGLTDRRRLVINTANARVDVQAADGQVSRGAVTGGGAVVAGQAVKLVAKPEKGYVFGGWSGEDLDSRELFERLNPTVEYLPHQGENGLVARFIEPAEDHLTVFVEERSLSVMEGLCGSEAFDGSFGIESGSLPTVAVTGLPTGLKFDAKTWKITGVATKAGVYWVTVTAKNQSGYEHSAFARWTVGEPDDPDFDDIGGLPSWGNGHFAADSVFEEWAPADVRSVSVKGLPDGLSFKADAESGSWRLEGTLKKPGVFVVETSVTYDDGLRASARQTVVISDAGSVYYRVRPEAGQDARGTVTGGGVYRVGATVKLTAKANAGFVFGEWSGGVADTLETAFANQAPILSSALPNGCGNESVATFLSLADDRLSVSLGERSFPLNEPIGEWPAWDVFDLNSGSAPTVSLSGLPTGLKFDAKTMVLSGKPTKEGVFLVTLAVKNASGCTQSAFANWTVGEPEWPYYDDIGLPSCGDGQAWGEQYEDWLDVSDARSFTIKGLPSGLKSETKGGQCRIYGTLGKAGACVVEATYVSTDGETRKARKQVIVHDATLAGLNVRLNDSGERRGTVTGGGVYPAGTSAKLTAKAEKGFAFAGWWGEKVDGLDLFGRLNPALAVMTGSESGEIVADFISPREDWLWVEAGEERQFSVGDSVVAGFWDFFSIDSGSLPTVAVTGLPTGLKYDAKARTISGKVTKEGVYWIEITAKNASGYEHSAVARWIVGNPSETDYDDIGDLPSFGHDRGTGDACCERLPTATGAKSVTVKGLPAGLSLVPDGDEWWIDGVLTKPGVNTVELTVDYGKDIGKFSARQTVVVRDNGSCYLDVISSSNVWGTVTGGGVYRFGATVKVSAKAAKDCVFAGWFWGEEGSACMDSGEWRKNADSFAYRSCYGGQELIGRFYPVESDAFVGLSFSGLNVADDGNRATWNVREAESVNEHSVCWIDVDSQSLPTLSFKGLPSGCAWDAALSALVFEKIPSKAGNFDVTVTAKNVSGESATRQLTIDTSSATVDVTVAEGQEDRGTVTGGGPYVAGATAKLVAKAEKGFAFGGWSGEGLESVDLFDRLNPTVEYVTHVDANGIRAAFLAPWEDLLRVSVSECAFAVGETVSGGFWDFFGVESGSLPAIAVSGLPTGLKYDAKTRTVSGKTTKEGIFWVEISAKNASGYEHSMAARWTVGEPTEIDYDEIGELPSFGRDCGTGDFVEEELWVPEATKVSVKGLPKGLQLVESGDVRWISGVLTTPGVYTVDVTATYADRSTRSARQTVVVADNGSRYLEVGFESGSEGRGTVTGSGVYRVGATVKLTAKAENGQVFAGWYLQDASYGFHELPTDSGDWRTPSDTFVFGRIDAWTYNFWALGYDGYSAYRVRARFVPKAEDAGLSLWFEGSFVIDDGERADWRVREPESELRYGSCGVGVLSQSLPTLTFKGLPSGCTWEAETSSLVFDKVPSKPGSFDVTVTAKNASGATVTRTLTVVTANATLDVRVAEDCTGCGTVTGSGGFTAGTKTKITAKAEKGYVFGGWNGGTTDDLDWFVRLNPTLDYVPHLDANFVEAWFMPVSDDYLDFGWNRDIRLDVGQDVAGVFLGDESETTVANWVRDLLASGSFPTVSVSGLPKGISFDAKTLLLSGRATQPGVFYVTVAAKNAGGYVFDQTVRFIVGDVSLDEPDEIGEGWGVDFSAFDALRLGEPFTWSAESWMAISASGLPTGLALVRQGLFEGDEPYDVIRGTPTKAGKFTVKFTMKDPDTGRTLTTQKTVIVRGAPSAYIGVEQAAGGTVTGMGVYGAGATVKLVAKPSTGYVFAGWYNVDGTRCAIEGFDYRTPTLSCQASGPWTFEPHFVSKADDQADDYGAWGHDSCSDDIDWRVEDRSEYLLWVDSLSLPKLTVKGLPAGTELKGLYLDGDEPFPAYRIQIKDKSKLKPGRYPVTVTAENQSKVKRTWSFYAIVPNLTSEVIHGLDSSDEGYQLWVGVGGYLPTTDSSGYGVWNSFGLPFDNVAVDSGWTVSVDGLPMGMKYGLQQSTAQICCGLGRYARNSVYGVPTKAGPYTVTVSAKRTGCLTEKATAFVTVNERPSWAVGTFGGCLIQSGGGIGSSVTLTLAADGKVTGRVGTSSFSGTLDRYFEDEYGTCGFAGEVDYGILVVTPDPNVEGVGVANIYQSEPEWNCYWEWVNSYAEYRVVHWTWQNVWKLPGFDMTGISGLAGTLSNGLKVRLDGNGNAVVAGGLYGNTVSASFPLCLTAYEDDGYGNVSFRFQTAVSVLSGAYSAFVDIVAERYADGTVNQYIENER